MLLFTTTQLLFQFFDRRFRMGFFLFTVVKLGSQLSYEAAGFIALAFVFDIQFLCTSEFLLSIGNVFLQLCYFDTGSFQIFLAFGQFHRHIGELAFGFM